MFKKLSFVLNKKDQLKLKFILFLNSLMFFLELITLASVPFFVTSILTPDVVIIKFEELMNYQPSNFFKDNDIIFDPETGEVIEEDNVKYDPETGEEIE